MRERAAPQGIAAKPGWWADVAGRHLEPPRAYHGIRHVTEVLAHWSAVDHDGLWADGAPGDSTGTDRVASWVAVLLHDAVYEAGQPDNEARSAELVAGWVHNWLELPCTLVTDIVNRARQLILKTAEHGRLRASEVDSTTALFLDCDMAILGASAERFDQYCDQIAREYADVASTPVFEAGRTAFLQRLLTQPIYLSDRFRDALEERARANIERVLAR